MGEAYVSVTGRGEAAALRVELEANVLRFPLTKAGCLEAGRELFRRGKETWLNSSSVDFPKEYKKGFRYDVRELMSEGYSLAAEEKDAPRKRLIDKMIEAASGAAFQATLDDDEKAAFAEVCRQYRS